MRGVDLPYLRTQPVSHRPFMRILMAIDMCHLFTVRIVKHLPHLDAGKTDLPRQYRTWETGTALSSVAPFVREREEDRINLHTCIRPSKNFDVPRADTKAVFPRGNSREASPGGRRDDIRLLENLVWIFCSGHLIFFKFLCNS